jgi:hypothetical protein
MKVDHFSFRWGGLHGKYVVATGKGKTGTIPAFAVGRAAWEVCSGNWERKNGNHPSLCSRTQENQENPVSRWPVRAGPSEPVAGPSTVSRYLKKLSFSKSIKFKHK